MDPAKEPQVFFGELGSGPEAGRPVYMAGASIGFYSLLERAGDLVSWL